MSDSSPDPLAPAPRYRAFAFSAPALPQPAVGGPVDRCRAGSPNAPSRHNPSLSPGNPRESIGPVSDDDPYIQHLFAERIGGKTYGKGTEIYKFERIKRAKRAALAANPGAELIDMGVGEP